jgi:DNA-binding response OmpR family regulator
MVTGAAEPSQVKEGLNAGVFYYLTKPVENAVVGAVVNSAVTEGRRRRSLNRQLQQHNGLAMLQQGLFHCNTIAQAEETATQLASLFPQPARALGGIAALLLNAVEHGLLGIGYQRKGELLATETWLTEIESRESLPENRAKTVKVAIERQPDRTRLTIADPGPGFDWRAYLDFSHERATARHGRGIAQARASGFDKLAYNPAGNIVQAEAGIRPDLDW